MPSVNIKGYQLEYLESGNGEPLVFVHGSASDYRIWRSQQDEFSKFYRTITYSRRYHFPNEPVKDGTEYSMAEHVDDLKEFLIEMNAVPANLVGHSYGAFICLLLSVREPKMVRSLILAEPPVITLFVSNNPKPSEILKLVFKSPKTAASIIKFGVKGINPAVKELRKGNIE
jgi:pimeloyl-ACP methyl ester carboxylesterase